MTLQQLIVFGTLGLALGLCILGRWRYDMVALLALLLVTVTAVLVGSRAATPPHGPNAFQRGGTCPVHPDAKPFAPALPILAKPPIGETSLAPRRPGSACERCAN